MNERQVYTLRDLLEIKYGKDHKKLGNGIIPVFGSGGLMRYADTALYGDESILIPRKGSLNNIMYVDTPFWTVDTMFYTRPNKKLVNTKFLYYLLTQIDFANMNVGSAVPSMTVETLYELEVEIPPLPEQQAIAEVLSSLDDKIDLLHRNNKTLEEMAEVLFNKWFITDITDEYNQKPLDEIAQFLNGLALQKYPVREGEPSLTVIKIKEMNNGVSSSSELCSANVPEQYVVRPGDVLFSWSGSLEVMIWSDGIGALNQHLFKVTSKEYPLWLAYFAVKHFLPGFRDIAADKATTMGHIQRKHLSESILSIPPSEALELVNSYIAPLFAKLTQNKFSILKLRDTRDLLLPKLMSGALRVKDFTHELSVI